jgi:hypothetical protein
MGSGQVCWQGCSSAALISGSYSRQRRDIRTRPNKNMDELERGEGGSPDDFLTEEDVVEARENKIDLPYFEQITKVLTPEQPIINGALFQTNHRAQKAEFLAGTIDCPDFTFRELMTPEKYERGIRYLDQLEKDVDAETNPALQALYRDKILEMRYQLMMRLAAGKDPQALFEASLYLYGAPTEEEFRLALAEKQARRESKAEKKSKEGKRVYTAHELCVIFNRAIEELGIPRWEAILTNAAAITDDARYPGGPKIKIPENKGDTTEDRLAELVQHEIVTHLGRGRSGQLSKLALLGFMGADHYMDIEEGLATYAEQDFARLSEREPKTAGLNGAIAIGAAMGLDGSPRNFRETFEYLRNLGIKESTAWGQTRRVFRGIADTSKRDGKVCTLDWVYRKGNVAVWDLVRTEGEVVLDRLWVGKAGPHHLAILTQLGVTEPAQPRRYVKITDLLAK